MLYNLAEDISEQNDVALQNLNLTKTMLKQLGEWDVSLPHPLFLKALYGKNGNWICMTKNINLFNRNK